MNHMPPPQVRVPSFEPDFFSDEVILNPYPYYQQLRDAGPAVWLTQQQCWALTRYETVRDALLTPDIFSSAHGCMLNEPANQSARGSMLCSDDPEHQAVRRVFAKPLMPAALAPLRARLHTLAAGRIAELVARRRFDAVSELAHFLPLTVVTELVGLSEAGKANMLRWAAGAFNGFGPMSSPRTLEGLQIIQEAFAYLTTLSREDLDPAGWGAALFTAADRGALSYQNAATMLMDYLTPALDTTINATSALIELFAQNPDQWDKLRANPALIPSAIDEAIRLESPIRAFARYVMRDTDIGGVTLSAGSRALMLYACANRDERKFPDPDKFLIDRKARDHLGFGYGTHICAGMHLAKLEISTLLEILIETVTRFTLIDSTRTSHNTLRGVARLIVEVS
jgi:cytochrome P450